MNELKPSRTPAARVRSGSLLALFLLAGLPALVTPLRADNPPTFLFQWGSQGSGNGQFITLEGIAVDSSNNVYVVDRDNNNVQKFDSDGYYLTQWGNEGTGNGQFDEPYGIAVDSSNNVYVADTVNGRIEKFTSNGIYLTQWGSVGSGNGQFNEPEGIAVDSSNNVYVTDVNNVRVEKFDHNGNYLTQWGSLGSGNGQFDYLYGIAVDASNNVYVADSGNYRIEKFTSNGNYLTQWGSSGSGNGQFDYPSGIAVDASNNVYVADSGIRIEKFTSNGNYLTQWGSSGSGNGQFSGLESIAVDSTGNFVYVADLGNDRIQVFANSTALLPPYITSQPASQNVVAGTNVSFSVTAVGGEPLTYQWTSNTVALFNVTNSTFTLANVSPADAATYAVLVTNSFGNATSSNIVLTVVPAFVNTLPATGISAAGAVLNGSVTIGEEDTVIWFNWGTNTSYGNMTAMTIVPGGSGTTNLSVTLNGLSTNGYHYQIVATNISGIVHGNDQSFVVADGNPTVTTLSAAPGGTTNGVTLSGMVNPNGLDTTVYFKWGVAGGSLSNSTPPTDAGAGAVSLNVSSFITGVAEFLFYSYQAVASNSLGTKSGAVISFQDLPPPFTSAPFGTWQSVASSTDGSRLIAGANGSSGAPGGIYVSTNHGATWTTALEANAAWEAVATSAGGDTLIAASTGSFNLYISTNSGTTFVPATFPSYFNWSSVACSADGTKLAAISQLGANGQAGSTGEYTSTDSGLNWTPRPSGLLGYAVYIASSADGNKLILGAGGDSGIGSIYTSADAGVNWTRATNAPIAHWYSVASSANGNQLLACSYPGNVYLSTNAGVNWTKTMLPTNNWNSVAESADGSKAVALANSGSATFGVGKGGIWTSTDSGNTWISNNVPSASWTCAAMSADGNEFVASMGNPSIAGGIYVSQTTPVPVLTLSASDNTLISWMVPSLNFTLQQSSDLSNWTDMTNVPVLNFTNLENQVALPSPGGNSFFRLKSN
jgi:DNA-binding beta-propeller fold protein YncE